MASAEERSSAAFFPLSFPVMMRQLQEQKVELGAYSALEDQILAGILSSAGGKLDVLGVVLAVAGEFLRGGLPTPSLQRRPDRSDRVHRTAPALLDTASGSCSFS